MKTTIAALTLTLTLTLALTARAADNVTSNYLGYVVFIEDTFADAGDTGLTVSNAYFCIPATTIGVTTGNYEDVRAVMYQIVHTYETAWTASTNQSPSAATRSVYYAASGTNVLETVIHTLKTIRQYGAATLP